MKLECLNNALRHCFMEGFSFHQLIEKKEGAIEMGCGKNDKSESKTAKSINFIIVFI